MAQSSSKVVAITGASSGIGRATARHFAREGWDVGLIARNEEGLRATERDVAGLGRRAAVATADVSDSAALERAASAVEAALGPIDVWINDAGVGIVAPFMETSEEEFRRVTEIVYFGTVNGVRIALKRMLPRNRGTIVNVVSSASYRALPLQAPYSGAKYAIRGFTEAVRSELIHDASRVHLTMVHPPAVNTPFFSHSPIRWSDETARPPPPAYQPELIADAIYFAATHRRREMLIGGQTVQMAWMNKLFPAATDWLLGKVGHVTQRSKDPEALRLKDPNLFEANDRVHDVRGPWTGFEHSAQLWASKNRAALGVGLGAGLLLLAAGVIGRRP